MFIIKLSLAFLTFGTDAFEINCFMLYRIKNKKLQLILEIE